MTVTEESATDDDTPKVDLTAPDTRAAGRWNSAGMPTERSAQFGTAVRRLFHLLRPERPILALVASRPSSARSSTCSARSSSVTPPT